ECLLTRAVAGGQAPAKGTVALPGARVADRIGALGERGAARVLEVVDAERPGGGIADAAEVDPDVGILVAEERPEGDPLAAVPLRDAIGAAPRCPRAVGQWVRRRSEAEEVEDHRLAVAFVGVRQEAGFGAPAVG